MAVEDEFERTFLVKYLPSGIKKCDFVELKDNYIPKKSNHPILRIRKKGDKTVITKKYKKKDGDASVMVEETIVLSPEEYGFINKLEGKKFSKKRYIYEYRESKFCEIDVYQDKLKGLVIADFEFKSIDEKDDFKIPDFCLVEITNEELLTGGMLCGKSYRDLMPILKKFNYNKIE